tara:strand:+ start:590 stop:1378 length:789 start_codon:yes stop_codon:yes gene_type:complete
MNIENLISNTKQFKLKCIFLNCFLRSPNWIFYDDQIKRIPKIIDGIVAYNPNIIGLSEVFGKKHISIMKRILSKKGYTIISPNCFRPTIGTTDSGLLLAIKSDNISIISSTFINFEHNAFPDNLAEKGFFIVRIKEKYTRQTLIIVITHLQAQYSSLPSIYEKVQIKQLIQLSNYIKYFQHNNQYIIMGDFNINVHKFSLASCVLNYFFPQSKLKNRKITTSDKSYQTLDYIFSSLPITDIKTVCKNSQLSDHYAIYTEILL